MKENKTETYKATMRRMTYVTRLHRAVFERDISKLGIHHSQHHLLMYIAKEREISSQKEIAERFSITPAAVARSMKALEAEGYIRRESIEGDSRYNKIVITEKGDGIAEASFRMFSEIDGSLFEDFDDDELAQFNASLEKLQSKLSEKLGKNFECCCVRKK